MTHSFLKSLLPVVVVFMVGTVSSGFSQRNRPTRNDISQGIYCRELILYDCGSLLKSLSKSVVFISELGREAPGKKR